MKAEDLALIAARMTEGGIERPEIAAGSTKIQLRVAQPEIAAVVAPAPGKRVTSPYPGRFLLRAIN